jgi:SSS family solute:Na+ symporter
MLSAAAWAPQIDKFPTLWQYLQSALSYIVPPIVALFFLGVFWKRANADGAMAGITIGVAMAVFFMGFSGSKWVQAIHFLYIAAFIFVMSCLAVFMVSLLTPPPPAEKVKGLTWQKELYDMETAEIRNLPFIRNYRYQAIFLITFLALILLLFW